MISNARSAVRHAALGLAALLSVSCSLTSVAAKAVGSGGGSGALGVFMRENDPEIVADALPTLIKALEALLASDPDDRELSLTVGSAYIMYANAFIEGPAILMGDERYEEKALAKKRALNFYKRGANFVGSAIERSWRGATTDAAKAEAAARSMKRAWVPYLYWYSAGTAAAFALAPMDLPLSMRVPAAKALMERALELEPSFMKCAIPDFFISFHAGVPEVLGGEKSRVDEFYRLSLKLSGEKSAGTFISYAMATAVPAQDSASFRALMERALAINPDDDPDTRLMTVLSQRTASHYLAHMDDFFLE